MKKKCHKSGNLKFSLNFVKFSSTLFSLLEHWQKFTCVLFNDDKNLCLLSLFFVFVGHLLNIFIDHNFLIYGGCYFTDTCWPTSQQISNHRGAGAPSGIYFLHFFHQSAKHLTDTVTMHAIATRKWCTCTHCLPARACRLHAECQRSHRCNGPIRLINIHPSNKKDFIEIKTM